MNVISTFVCFPNWPLSEIYKNYILVPTPSYLNFARILKNADTTEIYIHTHSHKTCLKWIAVHLVLNTSSLLITE